MVSEIEKHDIEWTLQNSQISNMRWLISERTGRDVGIFEAIDAEIVRKRREEEFKPHGFAYKIALLKSYLMKGDYNFNNGGPEQGDPDPLLTDIIRYLKQKGKLESLGRPFPFDAIHEYCLEHDILCLKKDIINKLAKQGRLMPRFVNYN